MCNLLIDIGNTRIKWASETHGQLSVGESQPASLEGVTNLVTGSWREIRPQQILASCVAGKEVKKTLEHAALKLCETGVKFLVTPKQGEGVTNAYHKPETMGPDRWAAMVAAYRQEQAAVCVVSCGTAMTLDIIDSGGLHLGGLILPGLRLQQQCISENTASIQQKDNEVIAIGSFGLGQSTLACLQQGGLTALRGTIGQVLEQDGLRAIKLIMTGGDAEAVGMGLARQYRIEPDLVLQGLAYIIQSKAKESLL